MEVIRRSVRAFAAGNGVVRWGTTKMAQDARCPRLQAGPAHPG